MTRIMKTLLALALCVTFIVPCAAAESAYVPGRTTNALFADAWNSGKMINGSLSLDLAVNAETLGLTGDDIAQMDALLELISKATLRMGVCRIDGGMRIAATGMLAAQEGAQDVQVSGAIDLTADGLSVDSSLIPGKRLTMTWETVLQMCGLSSSDIAMLMSLRDIDLDQLLDTLITQLNASLALASQFAAPYADILSAWFYSLPMEYYEDVAATEDYPAAALIIDVYVTEKALGELVTQLATQLEADTTLCALFDVLLAELDSGSTVTTAALCAAMREQAAAWTDEAYPLTLTIAFNESGTPIYGELFTSSPDGYSEYAGLFLYERDDDPNTLEYDLSIYTMTTETSVDDGFSIYGTLSVDPATMLLTEMTANAVLISDGEMRLGMNYTVASAATTTPDGLPGISQDTGMSMSLTDRYKTMQMLTSGHAEYSMTANGGEQTDVTISIDMYVNDQSFSANAIGSMIIEPDESGLTGSYSIMESIPAAGIERYGIDLIFSCEDYAPAELTEVALETASEADLNALSGEAYAAMQELSTQIVSAIPAETLTQLQMLFSE